MEEKFVFIMEMYGRLRNQPYFRGIAARHEQEAREIAIQRGHEIKGIVRVEKLIEKEGEMK